MYEIDEENNAITVISRDYYESYWAEKNGKAEIVSLTSDEVLFIIQDSINLYCKYDKIILNIFSENSDTSSYEIIPLTGDTIGDRCFPDVVRDWGIEEYILDDISRIIQYRISSLSSPEAYISCKELAEYADVKVGNSLEYNWSKLYFPGIKDINERKEILEEYKQLQYFSSIRWMEYREVICFKYDNNYYLSVEAPEHYTSSETPDELPTSFFGYFFESVFPTDEIKQSVLEFWNATNCVRYASNYVDNDDFGVWFELKKAGRTFTMGDAPAVSNVMGGRYEIDGNMLTLYFDVDYEGNEEVEYVFELVDDKYIYSEKKSVPLSDGKYKIEDGEEFVFFK